MTLTMTAPTTSATTVAPEIALRLTVAKTAALRHLKIVIGQGIVLRRRRVRYVEDLEDVRSAKAEWVQTYSDVLRQLFHGDAGGAVADACNNWVGRVYPEYAQIELFVEQFYEEIDYRISRLRDVARQVAEMIEIVPSLVPAAALTWPTTHAVAHDPPQPEAAASSTLPPAESTPASITPAIPAPTSATNAPMTTAPPTISLTPMTSPTPMTTAPTAAATAPTVPTLAPTVPTPVPPVSTGLLVIRGQASPASDSVGVFLKTLGIDVAGIHAELSGEHAGEVALAALEKNPDAAFALLVLGRDDAAALRAPGACGPGVAFQLGYLVGRLGLSRVCVLCEGGSEVFNDPHGILCLPIDPADGWHLQLARHLRRAGIEVDLNRLCQ